MVMYSIYIYICTYIHVYIYIHIYLCDYVVPEKSRLNRFQPSTFVGTRIDWDCNLQTGGWRVPKRPHQGWGLYIGGVDTNGIVFQGDLSLTSWELCSGYPRHLATTCSARGDLQEPQQRWRWSMIHQEVASRDHHNLHHVLHHIYVFV